LAADLEIRALVYVAYKKCLDSLHVDKDDA